VACNIGLLCSALKKSRIVPQVFKQDAIFVKRESEASEQKFDIIRWSIPPGKKLQKLGRIVFQECCSHTLESNIKVARWLGITVVFWIWRVVETLTDANASI